MLSCHVFQEESMNNKKLGTQFEKETCELLARYGWWVHFLSPNEAGAQPFDIIAVRNGKAIAIDCKTSVSNVFPINRLEDNQQLAFERWMRCKNLVPLIFVKYKENIHIVNYYVLHKYGKVDLESGNYILDGENWILGGE